MGWFLRCIRTILVITLFTSTLHGREYAVLPGKDSLNPCPVHSGFSVAQSPICQLDHLQFINGSWNATSYQWFFNGAFFSCDQHPVLQIPSAGYHHIVLISSDYQCSDTAEMWVRVNPLYHAQYTVFLCPGETYMFAGHELSMSGIFTAEYTSVDGCDSIVDLFLQVDTLQGGFTVQGGTAMAASGNKYYQWFNCDQGFLPVAGAIHPLFSPVTSGNYALVTGSSLCVDSSDCQYIVVTGTDELSQNPDILFLPNPAKTFVDFQNLIHGHLYRVTFMTTDGRLMHTSQLSAELPRLDLHAVPPGLYLVCIQAPDEQPRCHRLRVE